MTRTPLTPTGAPTTSAPARHRLPTRTARLRAVAAIAVGRATQVAIRLTRRGGGGTAFPGLLASKIAPTLLGDALSGLRGGLVVVTGSSGKSTTTKLLARTLAAHGLRVFTNASTANIQQGLLSDMLRDLRYNGRLASDIAVLEMDEAHAAKILQRVRPTTVVMTNIGTDQVDRFADPADVAHLLQRVAASATTRVISNADDAMLEQIVASLPGLAIYRYGVDQAVLDATPHGLGNAREADHRLVSGTIVESVSESSSSIRHNDERFEVSLPARGPHYAVDVAAAIAAASAILGKAFSSERARAAIQQPDPVFGRNQLVSVRGKQVEMVLVQNPASFQLNIDYLPKSLDQVMVAVGSDVRDFSYLWPVDTSPLSKVDMVSGTLAEELALQFAYRDVSVAHVDNDLRRALDEFVALPDPRHGVKTIIFSADAMRKTRRHFGIA